VNKIQNVPKITENKEKNIQEQTTQKQSIFTKSTSNSSTMFGGAKPKQTEEKKESIFQSKKPEEKKDPVKKPTEAKTQLFGSKAPSGPSKSVFVHKPDTEETKNIVNVFSVTTSATKGDAQPKNASKGPNIFDQIKSNKSDQKESVFAVGSKGNKTNVSIFAPKTSNKEPATSKPTRSLFAQKPKEISSQAKSQEKKEEAKKEEAKKEEVKKTTSLFASKPKETIPVTTEKKPSLFASKGVNIFGKSSDDTASAPKKVGLFGNNPVASKTGSLFGNSSKPSAEKKEENQEQKAKVKSLFGTSTTKPDTENKAKSGTGLFGGTSSLFKGKSLFSGIKSTESNKNSFINSGKAATKKEKEEEKDQEKKEDTKPSFAAISKDPYTKIFNKQVEKFRTKAGDKGNGHLSVETGEKDGKKFVLFNFRNPIGKTLFTGQIVEACKKHKALDKPGKIQIKVVVIEKDMKTGNLTPMPSLISFNRTDDLKEFNEKWDEAKKFLA